MTYHKSDTLTPSDDGAKALGQRKYTNNWNMYQSSKDKWLPPLALVSSKYRTIPTAPHQFLQLTLWTFHNSHSQITLSKREPLLLGPCTICIPITRLLHSWAGQDGMLEWSCWNGQEERLANFFWKNHYFLLSSLMWMSSGKYCCKI